MAGIDFEGIEGTVANETVDSSSTEHRPRGRREKKQKAKAANVAIGGKKAGKKGIWPVTYKWAAMGTLVAYTALGSHRITLARAQAGLPPAQKQAQPQAQEASSTINFDIPPGMLGDVLNSFHTVTGLEVMTTNEGIYALSSSGVVGVYTNDQALQHILQGTGVTYRFSGGNLVRLDLASLSQSVTVSASGLQSDKVETPKYTEPVLDTPQTIAVVPQHVMSEQNTTTLTDALRNVAGISIAAGEGSSQGNSFTIRGFTARSDIFLDGIRDFGSYYRDTFNFDEVQILEGPSAITFGRGTTGGVVSEVSKVPVLSPFIAGNVTGGSDLTRRVAVDVNEPIPQLGSGAAFRLNLMGDANNIAGRDIAEYRRYGFAPSLAVGMDGPTRLVISYFHQSESDIPDYGVPWYFSAAAPVARHNYYGFKNGNFLRTNDDIFTVKVEHDVSRNVTLRNVIRYNNEGRDAQITEPQVIECASSPTNPLCVFPSTPLAQIQINRNQLEVDSTETAIDDQFDATVRFQTGIVKHTLVAGVEGIRETSDPTRYTFAGVPSTSLLNPNESQPYSSTGATLSQQVNVTASTLGVYALDTLQLGSKFDIVAGGRWDRFDASYFNTVPLAPSTSPQSYQQNIGLPSWRAALVYKPKPNGAVYFSAGNSSNPSAETLSLSASNTALPPEQSLTYEGGTKWDFPSRRLSVTGSVFRTDMLNARETDPTNSLLTVLGGNQRVDGFQAGITGHLTRRWELNSSYALLESKVVSSTFFPAAVGVELANVPKNTFNFWSTYRLPWRNFLIGGGGNFVDRRTASSTVPYDAATGLLKAVPGYWVFNAMARYPLGERASLQANFYNLANTYYIDQVHPAHIVPGAAFTALVGLNFRF